MKYRGSLLIGVCHVWTHGELWCLRKLPSIPPGSFAR